jgi:predicted transcriptional regulator
MYVNKIAIMDTLHTRDMCDTEMNQSKAQRAMKHAGMYLRARRIEQGLSQTQVAHALGATQKTISGIEHRADVFVSTFHAYLSAIGLTFVAQPSRAQQDSEELVTIESGQLSLPLFPSEKNCNYPNVIFSIKPNLCDEIFSGRKTVEFRRRFPVSIPRGTIAYIYATRPRQQISGRAQIKDVLRLPKQALWTNFGQSACLDKRSFEEYFSGKEEGIAIELSQAYAFERPISLSELQDFCSFTPPQSFAYVSPKLRKRIINE